MSSNREFAKIAPLLWMRAGSRGRRIDDLSSGWDVADIYGVLADLDQTEKFLKAVAEQGEDVAMVFVVTDEDRLFQSVVRELPDHVEAVRLYEAYLRNFEIESGQEHAVKFRLQAPTSATRSSRSSRTSTEPRSRWHRDDEVSSFSLTATTGAGKTVMAAAAIEALFYGSAEFDVEADPGAVVIWFSDDPALNLQTRDRLMEASEEFVSSDLVVIEPPFSKPKLEPGKVYFLNTGKLGKNSLLTRGHVAEASDDQIAGLQATPDMQGWTIWETISNTIDDDDLTVYLILDEAHRGFNPAKVADKPTLVRRLINGHAGYRPIPVVWGISATIERFDAAMKAADASEEPARVRPRAGQPLARAGVRPGQGHDRADDPRRSGSVRHHVRAARSASD